MNIRKSISCLLVVSLLTLTTGCATIEPINRTLPEFNFEKETEYILDLSELSDPEAPEFTFLKIDGDGNYMVVSADDDYDVVALDTVELQKIEHMLVLKNTYEELTHEQAVLINTERSKISALKSMLEIERMNRQMERDLRISAEELYKKEVRSHKLDNMIHRGIIVLTIVGGIALVAL